MTGAPRARSRRIRYNPAVKPLLIGLVALALGAELPGMSAETRALIEHAPAVASPMNGYLTLGEFFVKNNSWEHARQIFAYALLHSPSDPRILSWLAVIEEHLGHADPAREYALAALSFEPGNGPSQEVLVRLAPKPTASAGPGASPGPRASAAPGPAPSPKPGTGAGGPKPGTGAGGPPSAAPSPAPAGLSVKEKDLLAKAVGVGTAPFVFPGKPPNVLDNQVRGDRLKALSVLKSVDAALRMYQLNHPKEEVKSLDLKKLVEDKVLPKEVDLSGFPAMEIRDGKLGMENFGPIDALSTDLADYQAGLKAAAEFREKGLIAEAHNTLVEMAKKFDGDPEVLERLLRTELEMKLDFPAAETARRLFLARPGEPRHLWTLAVLFYRSTRPEQARQIAELMPRAYTDGFYTPAARALVALVDAHVSPELIAKLVEQREAALAAEQASAAAPPPPPRAERDPASPSPASPESPSPAASASPAQ